MGRTTSVVSLVSLCLAACSAEERRGAPTPLPPAAAPVAAEPVTEVAPAAPRPAAAPARPPAPPAASLDSLRNNRVVGARPISSRTQSLKLWLEGGGAMAFKPFLRGNRRAVREVAYFLLARHLGVGEVPASTIREVPYALLHGLLLKGYPDRVDEWKEAVFVDDRGRVPGAAIAWIKGLDREAFEALGGRAAIRGWLAPARPAADEPPLASSSAAMIVLDYMTGNWDRFSGGNLFVDREANTLQLIDNNATFATWSERQGEKMRRLLEQTERFPRSLVERVRGLTAAEIDEVLAVEPTHRTVPLLEKRQVRQLLERRDQLLAHVDALVERHGAAAVLPFP